MTFARLDPPPAARLARTLAAALMLLGINAVHAFGIDDVAVKARDTAAVPYCASPSILPPDPATRSFHPGCAS